LQCQIGELPRRLDALRAAIIKDGITMVFVDPLQRYSPVGQENAMAQALELIAQETGTHVVIMRGSRL
jgi:hypothetical protein